MTSKPRTGDSRARPPPVLIDHNPLLRLLVAQAAKRGDTLAALADALGVTYRRLAQWRNGKADIAQAHREVYGNAAGYLGVPVVVVLTLAGWVGLQDFVWPSPERLSRRVAHALERLRQDPLFAAFVPPALEDAEPSVQLLVAFMYRELSGEPIPRTSNYQWLATLQQASLGSVEGALALEVLQKEARESGRIF